MVFTDALKLSAELMRRGLDTHVNDIKAMRYFSDYYVADGLEGFVPFELENKDGTTFCIEVRVTPLYFVGIGAYNEYQWEVR